MSKNYNEIPVKNNMKVDVETGEIHDIKERKSKEKIVSIQPTKVKRNLISRLITGVLGPEGLPSIGAYVNEEIVKPAIKNIIVEAVTSGINMIMYRGQQPPNNYRSGYNNYRPTNYNRPTTNYSSQYTSSQQPTTERKVITSTRNGVEEYVIRDRYDAANVLATLTEHADRYNNVSIADYYDLIGVPSQYTDNDWGWTIDTITRSTIAPVRGGYMIKFPPMEVL